MTIGELLDQRRGKAAPAAMEAPPAGPPRRRGRPPADPEAREVVVAFMTDFARELHDQAPLAATVSRVLGLFRQAGVPKERFGDFLYQARSVTQEHSAQITKRADGRPTGTRNKIPYFCAVLESLLGLREGDDGPAAASPPSSGGGGS